MTAETVKLTLEVPKGVIDFLTDLFKLGCIQQTPKGFLEKDALVAVKGILGDLPRTWFDEDKILKRYGLADE